MPCCTDDIDDVDRTLLPFVMIMLLVSNTWYYASRRLLYPSPLPTDCRVVFDSVVPRIGVRSS